MKAKHLKKYAYILTDFNYATLTSPYIFQKTVKYKLPLLRYCHHELAFFSKHFSFNFTTKLHDVMCSV